MTVLRVTKVTDEPSEQCIGPECQGLGKKKVARTEGEVVSENGCTSIVTGTVMVIDVVEVFKFKFEG